MTVKEILASKSHSLITVKKSTQVSDAMKLLITNKISCLPVIDDDQSLLGIVSDKDIFKKVYDAPDSFGGAEVGELMTTDLIVGLSDDDVHYIAGIMTNNRIRHVPIVENNKIVGLISVGDVVKTQMEDIRIENRYLKEYIDGKYPG